MAAAAGLSASSVRRARLRSCRTLKKAYADDLRIRWDHEHFAMEAIAIAPSEFREGCAVYSRNGVTVTAFEVDHGKYIKPAYGYRVDYAGRSVVISGDTRYSDT
jgi:ribonuclease Z